jgi:hypothetical protein
MNTAKSSAHAKRASPGASRAQRHYRHQHLHFRLAVWRSTRRFSRPCGGGRVRLDISEEILSETLAALREKFQWSAAALREAEKDIRSYTHAVTSTETLDISALCVPRGPLYSRG